MKKNRPRTLLVDITNYAKKRAQELYPECKIAMKYDILWVDKVFGPNINDFVTKLGIGIERY